MVATLYCTLGGIVFACRYGSREEAVAAFELARAAGRVCVLGLGGWDVRVAP